MRVSLISVPVSVVSHAQSSVLGTLLFIMYISPLNCQSLYSTTTYN